MSKKFKLVTLLFITMILMVAPFGLLLLPSWESKLAPMLNLVDTLLAEGAEEKILLGSFNFIGTDEDSLTLRLELIINNSGGPDMLFPAVNLSFNYGASHLGDGWISEDAFIPANSDNTTIAVYARMLKGDAFNMFFMSLIGGGLSLSISAGEAFVFLKAVGGLDMGCLSIPLPSIPLPAIELLPPGYPPTCHGIDRGDVTSLTDVEVRANVSDRGGGVKEVILSWDAGSGWANITMTQLPEKDLMGGSTNFFGAVFNIMFPLYPNSTVPTSWAPAIVSANIPGQAVGIEVKYRVYVVDVYNHTTLVPTTPPTSESGDLDTVNLTGEYFSYTVPAGTLNPYNASWEAAADGEAEPDMMEQMLESLEDSGINLINIIFAGSDLLAGLADLKIDLADIEGSVGDVIDLFIPLILYLDSKGLNPFEMLDQLLGLSGGMPGLPQALLDALGLDGNWTINANETIGMDMLMESGVGLLELMQFMAVNMTAMIDALGDSLMLPIASMPDKTPAEALYVLLNETRNNGTKLQEFIALLIERDAFHVDFPLLIYKYNSTDQAVIDKSDGPVDLSGVVDDSFYLGSPMVEGIIAGEYSASNFTIVNINMSAAVNNFVNGSTYLWEYNDSTTWTEIPQWEYFNGTHWVDNATGVANIANFTQSGRIRFMLPGSMAPSNFAGNTTYWIRVNISSAGVTTPVANEIVYSREVMEYHYNTQNVDLLGRQTDTITPNVTDSLFNLIWAANETNGLTMKLMGVIGISGITYEDILEEFGVTIFTAPPPVSGTRVLEASSPPMAFIVYSMFLFIVACSFRGRKGSYAISPIRVKKWYESNLLVPSMKTREELEKIKQVK